MRRPSLPVASLVLAVLVVTAGCASFVEEATTDVSETVSTTADGATTTRSAGPTDDGTAEPTATQVGGQSVVRASLVGVAATGVDASTVGRNETAALAATLGVDPRDVRVRRDPDGDTVEVFDANVSTAALRDALDRHGLATASMRVERAVTRPTQRETIRTLETRLDVLGIDATVSAARVDGRRGVAVRPADGNVSRVRDAITDRGRVEIVAHYPADQSGESANLTVLTNEDFDRVGTAQPPGSTGRQPYVPVTLTDDAAANFSAALVALGFTDEGVADCDTTAASEDVANASGYCLLTVHDGEVVYAAQMSRELAATIESGEFERDPRFTMTTTNASAAEELAAHLAGGALPTRLSFAGE